MTSYFNWSRSNSSNTRKKSCHTRVTDYEMLGLRRHRRLICRIRTCWWAADECSHFQSTNSNAPRHQIVIDPPRYQTLSVRGFPSSDHQLPALSPSEDREENSRARGPNGQICLGAQNWERRFWELKRWRRKKMEGTHSRPPGSWAGTQMHVDFGTHVAISMPGVIWRMRLGIRFIRRVPAR